MKYFIIFVLLFVVDLFANEKVVILAEDAWYPYSGVKSKEYHAEGISLDLVAEAFKRQGVNVEYKTMPYDRAKNLVRDGEYIACFNVPFEPVIETQYLWPQFKLFRARSYYYTRKDSPLQTIRNVQETGWYESWIGAGIRLWG